MRTDGYYEAKSLFAILRTRLKTDRGALKAPVTLPMYRALPAEIFGNTKVLQ